MAKLGRTGDNIVMSTSGYNCKRQYNIDGTLKSEVWYAYGPTRATEAEAKQDAKDFEEIRVNGDAA